MPPRYTLMICLSSSSIMPPRYTHNLPLFLLMDLLRSNSVPHVLLDDLLNLLQCLVHSLVPLHSFLLPRSSLCPWLQYGHHPQDLPAPGDGFFFIFSSTDLEKHSAVEISNPGHSFLHPEPRLSGISPSSSRAFPPLSLSLLTPRPMFARHSSNYQISPPALLLSFPPPALALFILCQHTIF